MWTNTDTSFSEVVCIAARKSSSLDAGKCFHEFLDHCTVESFHFLRFLYENKFLSLETGDANKQVACALMKCSTQRLNSLHSQRPYAQTFYNPLLRPRSLLQSSAHISRALLLRPQYMQCARIYFITTDWMANVPARAIFMHEMPPSMRSMWKIRTSTESVLTVYANARENPYCWDEKRIHTVRIKALSYIWKCAQTFSW